VSHIFISDLHLEEGRPEITDAFLHFLQNTAAQSEQFYILGDFFEVWLGDDHVSPFNDTIINALAALTMPRFIMHGNRDFLIGSRFCEQTGFTLLADPSSLQIYDQPVLLMHGDSLCTGDQEYMKVRRTARDPSFQRQLLAKSIEERAAFASHARGKSKQHTRETAMDIMDVTPSEVTRHMQNHDVSLFIHGHTHRPAIHEVSDEAGALLGQRVVLGDWDKQGWYFEISENEFELRAFDI
jgi:UDP-2,3-diacylglucosamine hydrolase